MAEVICLDNYYDQQLIIILLRITLTVILYLQFIHCVGKLIEWSFGIGTESNLTVHGKLVLTLTDSILVQICVMR